jgi:uncharacterized protein YdeI (YjbR/CyaY-like superfamily)
MSMRSRSAEVDDYIARAAGFARPILKRIRRLFHQACPDIQETIKWGFPHFEYKGVVASMAAFKHHAAFGFWKSKLLAGADGLFADEGASASRMSKLTSVSQLPADDVFLTFIREAVALNERGTRLPRKPPRRKPELVVPADLALGLKKNKKARDTFEGFSPSHRREYVEWITEAKQDETRLKRLATTLEWLAEGKPRNWKYMKKT